MLYLAGCDTTVKYASSDNAKMCAEKVEGGIVARVKKGQDIVCKGPDGKEYKIKISTDINEILDRLEGKK